MALTLGYERFVRESTDSNGNTVLVGADGVPKDRFPLPLNPNGLDWLTDTISGFEALLGGRLALLERAALQEAATVEFVAVDGIGPGLRVRSANACLDATVPGLLAARDRVAAEPGRLARGRPSRALRPGLPPPVQGAGGARCAAGAA